MSRIAYATNEPIWNIDLGGPRRRIVALLSGLQARSRSVLRFLAMWYL